MSGKPTLIGGPYRSPNVRVGDALTCAIRGLVEVKGWHEKGAIAVPKGGTRGSRAAIIVSHDLLRALSTETGVAIGFYWGVSTLTVERWRRALKINGRSTQAFLAAMSQVGSVTGRAPGLAERLRTLNGRPWAPDELTLLPLFSTREVAEKTGRTVEAVEHIRARQQSFQHRTKLTCNACGYSWLPQTNRLPKRCAKQVCRQPLLVR